MGYMEPPCSTRQLSGYPPNFLTGSKCQKTNEAKIITTGLRLGGLRLTSGLRQEDPNKFKVSLSNFTNCCFKNKKQRRRNGSAIENIYYSQEDPSSLPSIYTKLTTAQNSRFGLCRHLCSCSSVVSAGSARTSPLANSTKTQAPAAAAATKL